MCAQKVMTPEYLYKENSSKNENKFYIVTDTPDPDKILIGYGARGGSAAGVWKIYTRVAGLKKLAQKKREGYIPDNKSGIKNVVIVGMLKALKLEFSAHTFKIESNKDFSFDDLGDAKQTTTAKPPKKNNASVLRKLHVWI